MASTIFKILYISPTFTNITIPLISITFVVLWNARVFKIFCKIHSSNVFFFLYVPFLNLKHNIFRFFFIFMLRMTNLFFAFKNKNYRFYHERAFEMTDWLIWLVHQFWLVHLNKHQLVEILLTGCNYHQL